MSEEVIMSRIYHSIRCSLQWATYGSAFILMSVCSFGCDEAGSQRESDFSPPPTLEQIAIVACSDGKDNDLDGLIDIEDPGCEGPDDIDELNVTPSTECADGRDNDLDGLFDLADPDCIDSSWDDESTSPHLGGDDEAMIGGNQDEMGGGIDDIDVAFHPECSNQLDDDNDGLVDYPFDPGCASSTDRSESNQRQDLPDGACINGLDDDNDGFIDLNDPDCSSVEDETELPQNDTGRPTCFNGQDDDGDGWIDFPLDIGCSTPADQDEYDLPAATACSNHLDDDEDGLIDFPSDFGCISAGDNDETSPMIRPDCADGIDNDGDGLSDYPDDLECTSRSDYSEENHCDGRPIRTVSDGETIYVNSRQGRHIRSGSCGGMGAPEVIFSYRVDRPLRRLMIHTEFPDDIEMIDNMRPWETSIYAVPRCDSLGVELGCSREAYDGVASNQLTIETPPIGELLIFVDGVSGQGGVLTLRVDEVPIEACLNQQDDDGDGYIDFPSDPGCDSPEDPDEQSPNPLPACADGIDNDGDDNIDFPEDLGCRAASGNDEVEVCGQGVALYRFPGSTGVVRGYSREEGTSSSYTGSCGASFGIEQVFVYDSDAHAALTLTLTISDGSAGEATLYARRSPCRDQTQELGCVSGLLAVAEDDERDESNESDDNDPEVNSSSELRLALPDVWADEQIYIFVDHPLDGLPFELEITRELLPPVCIDGIDNDEDGFTDREDIGCSSSEDQREDNPDILPICADGVDNDGDGYIDYPLDPGCAYFGAVSEENPPTLPACADLLDNDGNGAIDFPRDSGCIARGDDTEVPPERAPKCSNLIDDDGDGVKDFPFDPGCSSLGDDSEVDDRTSACADGLDNDEDGLIDFPLDPGCLAAGWLDEVNPSVLPACGDGLDNDDDGLIDYPRDPGCLASGFDSEVDPATPPACFNGQDDDSNGRIDWPDDLGCDSRADREERGGVVRSTRCNDQVDNDDDGLIDLADFGCERRTDDDERDVWNPSGAGIDLTGAILDISRPLPECVDEVDNDGDGAIDLDDMHCAGVGTSCESYGQQWCGECVSLLDDSNHCGGCNQRCAEGVACIDGTCEGHSPIKPRISYCGFLGRSVSDLKRGPLDVDGLTIGYSCRFTEQTQALIVVRSGINGINSSIPLIKDYLLHGGVILVDQDTADNMYTWLFDMIPPTEQIRPNCVQNGSVIPESRPLWTTEFWNTIDINSTADSEGCALNLAAYEGIQFIGGWEPTSPYLGFIQYGLGRVWFFAASWHDRDIDDDSYLLASNLLAWTPPRHWTLLSECEDGLDNDNDGQTDLDDLGCQSAHDATEADQPLDVELPCIDGLDNDENGLIDFPNDPGCAAQGDLSEAPSLVLPECADRMDNNGDGRVDFPEDPHCLAAGDISESYGPRFSECADGLDNDEDGRVDYPEDVGCRFAADSMEGRIEQLHQPSAIPYGLISQRVACNNQLDDDADGLIDYPLDSGCVSTNDHSEDSESRIRSANYTPRIDRGGLPECGDGLDNDGDGFIDYPYDASCPTAATGSESYIPPSTCSDGVDNDGDGFIDYPNDPECRANGGLSERVNVSTMSACIDGLDNDSDGLIDLYDPSCADPSSNGELETIEPEVDPECSNLNDEGEDLRIDYPNASECLSAGWSHERLQCPPDLVIQPLDTQANTQVTVDGSLDESVKSLYSVCTNRAIGQLYRYELNESAQLLLSASGNFPLGISLYRACDRLGEVGCIRSTANESGQPNPIRLLSPTLRPGSYLIGIQGPPRWGAGIKKNTINLAPDPQGFNAIDDRNGTCWVDGSGDALDCFGRIELSEEEGAIAQGVSARDENTSIQVGTHQLRIKSDFPHQNIWRVIASPTGISSNDLTALYNRPPVRFAMSGRIGADAPSAIERGNIEAGESQIEYIWFEQNGDDRGRPAVLIFVVSHGPSVIDFTHDTDFVSLLIEGYPPFGIYVALSHHPLEFTLQALLSDIERFGGFNEVPQYGDYQLTVQSISVDE